MTFATYKILISTKECRVDHLTRRIKPSREGWNKVEIKGSPKVQRPHEAMCFQHFTLGQADRGLGPEIQRAKCTEKIPF